MGGTTYDRADWIGYTARTSTMDTRDIFKATGMSELLDPAKINLRESRDSDVNQVTTPVFVAIDLTGSMGGLARQIVTKGLGQIFEELIERKVVPGPQFAFAGFGDVIYDSMGVLQVSQFESDTSSLTPQIEATCRVGEGGGCNGWESENLAWYFASTRIAHDAQTKRGKRGYLFTVGDEEVPADLTPAQIKKVFGVDVQSVPSNKDLLSALGEAWHVFHIMVEQGSHMRSHRQEVIQQWTDLLGERALLLENVDNLSEVIVSAIQVVEGAQPDDVADTWGGSTSLVVAKAIGGLTAGQGHSTGVMRL